MRDPELPLNPPDPDPDVLDRFDRNQDREKAIRSIDDLLEYLDGVSPQGFSNIKGDLGQLREYLENDMEDV